jgi:ubiquitin-like modifier-activating enzyme ATG7
MHIALGVYSAHSQMNRAPTGSVPAKGSLKNFNTIEEFKAADKTKLFNEYADKVCLCSALTAY